VLYNEANEVLKKKEGRKLHQNLPDTSFWVVGLFALACCKFILEKVDNLCSFLNFIHYFWVVV
jgi:hypothetical protein